MTLMDRLPIPDFSETHHSNQLSIVELAQQERYYHWQEAASKQKKGGGAKKGSGQKKSSSPSDAKSLAKQVEKMTEAKKEELKKIMGLI